MDVQISTRPITLGQLVDVKLMSGGDYEALLRLITARTNLTEHEARELTLEESCEVINKIVDGIMKSNVLDQLSKQFEGGLG
jgi:hypothetical protein